VPVKYLLRALAGAGALFFLLCWPGTIPAVQASPAAGGFRLSSVGPGGSSLAPGERCQLALTLIAPAGAFIGPPETPAGVPPGKWRVTPPPGIKITGITYPPAGRAAFPGRTDKVPAYSGVVFVRVGLMVLKGAAPGPRKLTVALTATPWTASKVLPPVRLTLEAPIRVSPAAAARGSARTGPGTAVAAPVPRPGSPAGAAARTASPPAPASLSWEERLEAWFQDIVKRGGLWLTLLALFLIGLAMNLTPCCFPLIPITVSYFAGQEKGRHGRLIIHGGLYLLGLALTFSAFGGLLALTGKSLGNALQHPVVLVLMTGLMVALALSMFGLWEIRLPARVSNWAGKSRTGYGGTLFMGLVMGLLATPCLSPILLGLGTLVARTQDVHYGMLTFFVMALGMGLPLAVLAVFSGEIERLPKSGAWMVWVRKVFGCLLLAMALFYAQSLMPAAVVPWVVLVLGVGTGLWLSVLDRTKFKSRFFTGLKYSVAIVLIVGTVFIFWQTVHRLPWRDWRSDDLIAGRAYPRPVMVFVSTPGCGPCEQMKLLTFPRPGVRKLAGRFVLISLDLGRVSAEARAALIARLNIRKTPTTMFFDRRGRELTSLRLAGFAGPGRLTRRMLAALGSAPVSSTGPPPRWNAYRPGLLASGRPGPIMIMFSQKGCPECDRLKAEFTAAADLKPDFAALAGRFRLIQVFLDGPRPGPEIGRLTARFGDVRRTPTLFILYRRGGRVQGLRLNGYQSAAVLAKNMRLALAPGRPAGSR
jgi:thiol:disulfide interchange protein DsbD